MQLADESLFRQQCYLNGEWVDADDGATLTVVPEKSVNNP